MKVKKLRLCFVVVAISVLLFSCKNSTNTVVVDEEGGIQIDLELKELGELNALLLQYDDAGDKLDDCIAVKSKKKWGLINLKGDTVIDFKYDKIERLTDAEFWNIKVKNAENSKYSDGYDVGIADLEGNIIVKPIKGNQSIVPISEGLYEAQDGRFEPHLYNAKGEEIILSFDDDGYDFPLSQIKRINDKVFMVKSADNIWYRMIYNKGSEPEFKIDTIGYLDVKPSIEICVVKNEEGKWGAINSSGEVVAPFEYADAKMLGNDNVFVQNDEGKWGVFNGKNVSSYYDDFYRSIDDYSIGQDGDTYVILDKHGKELFRNSDLQVHPFYSNGMFLGKHSVYDPKGNKMITLTDSLAVVDYLNGYVVVGTENGNYGLIDKDNKIVVPVTNYMNPIIQKGSPLILFTQNISDVIVDGERIIVNITDVFNTEKGTLTKTKYDLNNFKDGFSLAIVEGRHIYVNEEGKTGILNLEEVLAYKKEQAEQAEKAAQPKLEESIKKQIVKLLNESQGWKVLSSPSSVWNLQKVSEGIYKAEYMIETEYEKMDYELQNIEVDENGKVLSFYNKRVGIRPKANKPDGGIIGVDELVDKITGRIRRK